jgi:protein-L-isoaspartate(D-aspartate) O-methyltransferase
MTGEKAETRRGPAMAVVVLCIVALILVFRTACCEPTPRGVEDSGRTTPIAPQVADTEERQPSAVPLSSPPRTTERAEERHHMVDRQIAPRGIDDQRVLEAMRNVPRHWFVPPSQLRQAYNDYPLPIGYDQTISQPYIVAIMTEMLELKPGEKVLEIGTGSGYQAAVLAELTDKVYTIEIVEPLAKRTIALLKEKGYSHIHVRVGDGYQGWPEAAPFDAIIVTCAPESPPPPLVEQLAPGGRMCIPVGSQWGGQQLILLRKEPDGTLTRKHVEWVRFVPMTGQAQEDDD